MPRPSGRGGNRQGVPGKTTYSGNRSDLMVDKAPSTGANTPASGGTTPAPAPSLAGGWVHPDAVTPLDAPSQRPGEPVTAGLPIGPGAGPEALAASPMDPSIATIQAAYLRNPTPELRRAIFTLMQQGAL